MARSDYVLPDPVDALCHKHHARSSFAYLFGVFFTPLAAADCSDQFWPGTVNRGGHDNRTAQTLLILISSVLLSAKISASALDAGAIVVICHPPAPGLCPRNAVPTLPLRHFLHGCVDQVR
jgi:hypothetical protein